MIKRLLAYLIKTAGIFLSFCGVTGLCIIILLGMVIKKVLSHDTGEIDYAIEWINRDYHLYFVSAYVIVCIVAIILLRRNYLKQDKELHAVKDTESIDPILKDA
jgi:hypothetical protein